MAEAIVFDTLRFVQNLTSKGFTQEQAEVLAYEHVQILTSNIATSRDLAEVQTNLETRLAEVRAEFNAKMEQTRAGLDAKADPEAKLEQAWAGLSAKIEQMRADLSLKLTELGTKIERTKTDLIKWMLGAMIVQTGLIVALVEMF